MIKSNGGIIGPDNVTTGGAFGSASGVFKLGEVTKLIRESKWPTAGPGGFQVANSCRFNDASSDHLTRSLGASETSTQKGTFSFWVKRSELSTAQHIYANEVADANNRGRILFESDGTLEIRDTVNSSSTTLYKTTQVFKDVGAWYNLVVAFDSTAGAGERITVFKNGTRIPDAQFGTSTEPSQNANFNIFIGGQTNKNHIGKIHGGANYFDGYLAEFVYCDGQVLDADSFGEFNSQTGIWVPKDVTGLTFGNNGFYQNYSNSGALGEDFSGKDNDFTVNNLTSIDQSIDSCTNNFATLNPLIKPAAAVTLSEGNLKGVFPGSWTALPANFGLTKGKWYFEAKNITSGQNAFIGVVSENQDWDDSTPYNETTGVVLYGPGGRKTVDNTSTDGFFATLSSGQIVGVALDLDSGTKTIQFSVNGTDTPNSTPVDLPSTFDDVFIFPYFIGNSSSATANWELNFGSPPYAISSGNTDGNGFGNFEYAVPTGYLSLNTKNLAAVLA